MINVLILGEMLITHSEIECKKSMQIEMFQLLQLNMETLICFRRKMTETLYKINMYLSNYYILNMHCSYMLK